MRHLLNPLLFWFAHASHRDLIRQLEFLKVENQILRGKLGRQVRVTPQERRRLIRLGSRVGPAIRQLLSIVTIKTWDRWLNGECWRKGVRPRKPGRPRTPEEIEELVLRIARETSWGFTRILGELKKLGIHTICRSTVVNILRRHGMEPGPQRGPGTWDQFIKRHARTLWACDFLPKRILTWRGWKDAYLLVFINVKSRRLWVSPATFHPTRAWTAVQAERFCNQHADDANAPGLVIRDRDSKFSGPFDIALRANNVKALVTQHCSPNMNAYAERVIQTLQHECLDHFVVCGTRHMDHLVREFAEHYHAERPHQSIGNVPPVGIGLPRDGPVQCRSRLGGLLRHYYRRAA